MGSTQEPNEVEVPAGPVVPARRELPGVEECRPAPRPLALLVGELEVPELLATLARVGYKCVRISPEAAATEIAELPAADVALLDVGTFREEPRCGVVALLQDVFPSVEVFLMTAARDLDAELMLRAIHGSLTDVLDPQDTIGVNSAFEESLHRSRSGAERVLAIGAHPDDVEIGCAGALLEHRGRGDAVTVLTLSRGSVGGDRTARAGESRAAASMLGARLLLGDLPDTRIEAGIETIRLIEAVVADVDPSTVYVHSAHDGHQDHRAVHTATLSATRRVPNVYAYQSPSATNDYSPTRFIPVDAVMSRKIEVLHAFASQSERSYLEPELVVAGARYWARHLAPRARYAEPFEVIRSFDPGAHRQRGALALGSPLAPVVPIPMAPYPLETGA
ncbi:PIG-L family deacetylase [Rothia sp. AR01]|uniref:PIG-L family deacetylase n=1 Tax=Rothia santali TaxID=2949643 RepID=A0A9X2HCF6_9MICC|nr:PIG-L deacetylase family protein [Rothia santali]MCP3427094.1 PIG-L family deacetylase [Rothia santali]